MAQEILTGSLLVVVSVMLVASLTLAVVRHFYPRKPRNYWGK